MLRGDNFSKGEVLFGFVVVFVFTSAQVSSIVEHRFLVARNINQVLDDRTLTIELEKGKKKGKEGESKKKKKKKTNRILFTTFLCNPERGGSTTPTKLVPPSR